MAQPMHEDRVWWWPLRLLVGVLVGLLAGSFLYLILPSQEMPGAGQNGGYPIIKYYWEENSIFPMLAYFWIGGAIFGALCGLLVTERYNGSSSTLDLE